MTSDVTTNIKAALVQANLGHANESRGYVLEGLNNSPW